MITCVFAAVEVVVMIGTNKRREVRFAERREREELITVPHRGVKLPSSHSPHPPGLERLDGPTTTTTTTGFEEHT